MFLIPFFIGEQILKFKAMHDKKRVHLCNFNVSNLKDIDRVVSDLTDTDLTSKSDDSDLDNNSYSGDEHKKEQQSKKENMVNIINFFFISIKKNFF